MRAHKPKTFKRMQLVSHRFPESASRSRIISFSAQFSACSLSDIAVASSLSFSLSCFSKSAAFSFIEVNSEPKCSFVFSDYHKASQSKTGVILKSKQDMRSEAYLSFETIMSVLHLKKCLLIVLSKTLVLKRQNARASPKSIEQQKTFQFPCTHLVEF